LQTGKLLPDMSVRERVALAKLHLQKSIEFKGEHVGILELRRHLSHYFKNLDNFKETRLKMVTSENVEELLQLLDYIAEQWS
jgi:tRNA-dihydrouridine synthase